AKKYFGAFGLGPAARIHCAVRHPSGAIERGPSFEIPPATADDWIRSFVASPAGDVLLIRRTRTAELVLVLDGRRILLDGPNYTAPEKPSVDHAVFSADGRYLVTASINGSLWLWRTSTGELVRGRLIDGSGSRDNLFSVALSPVNDTLVTTIR